ncbi:MAG TPA: hypothetical protein VLJ78_14540 [Microvirga sp.]|jgi:hypothetical protein|nr:hypothetical protein [Microvirga sp.]
MSDLMSSAEFWFGAFVLCIYQVAKFSELNSLDPSFSARSAIIPNLRASDFAGRFLFYGSLTAFLLATFLGYLLLCAASPRLLAGWAKVTGLQGNPEDFVKSVPYPLYIAAAFMGLTQPAIPILSKIGDMQRNVFHAWIGVPKRVVGTSTFFSNQILARSPDRDGLGRELQKLVSDSWLNRIDTYADTVFYRQQISRLKLNEDGQIEDILKGSKRELKGLIEQLVYAASLATVRESGGKGLLRLAADLGVTVPTNSAPLKDYLAGGVLCLIGMTLLWFLVPMFDKLALEHLQGDWDFWPNDLQGTAQYLLSHAVPVFVATVITLAMWSRRLEAARQESDSDIKTESEFVGELENYAGLILTLVLIVVLYDFAQALYDFGSFQASMARSPYEFIIKNVPFYVLHSFVPILACFVILLYVGRLGNSAAKANTFASAGLLVLVVGFASAFYAMARLYYQFNGAKGLDFIVLVVAVNVTAALLALATAALFGKRQIAARRRRSQQAVPPQVSTNVLPGATLPAGG